MPPQKIADIPDPRADALERPLAGVVGFFYPDREEEWDTICQAGFCGNFWPVPEGIEIEVPSYPGQRHRFTNAEAAFQATKFWPMVHEFEGKTGSEAFQTKKQHEASQDRTYGGFGSNWKAMLACLRAKFFPGGSCAELLKATGDTLLLEHNAVPGRDLVWSDNCDGEGTNWLGLQLMLVRDELTGQRLWTPYIESLVDLENGRPRSSQARAAWQGVVRKASLKLLQALQSPVSASGMADGSVDGQVPEPEEKRATQDLYEWCHCSCLGRRPVFA